MNPRGATEPNPNVTQNARGQPQFEPEMPPRPRPTSEAEARDALKRAEENAEAAHKRFKEATQDYVQHRANKPNPGRGYAGDPANYDPKWDQELYRDMVQRDQDAFKAVDEWRQAQKDLDDFRNAAQDARAAERGRQGRGGLRLPARDPQPANPLPGCPPNCGNNNPTGPAGVVEMPSSGSGDQLAVGSSGVASSSIPE